MLTKDTMQFISKGLKRSLSKKRAIDPRTEFRVKIPQDKLDLLVGVTLEDRYYVMSLLGKGGMSLVYKAKDKKTGEVVAVKCLRTQVLGDEMVVKRFQREAEVLNRLNHPRIVQFFGYGTNRRGQPYFVMDYLVGTSLGDILRREGHLDLGRFQDIFVQVAAAIGHAHKHDAVHRDIKPGNIMLVEKGGTSDYVKIVDFGIAKVTEGTQKLTRLGEVWGSPIYMSPEQCVGQNIDARTDIYSLGIVMYEALTGEVPFLGRNYADTMMKQMSEEPPPFKQANPNVDIPPALEQIVFRAIQKKPDDRYQTMGELKTDLERALNQSLGNVPKQQSSMLSRSGRQKTLESDQPKATPKATADNLNMVKSERPASDLQQRVTSEDIPKFAPAERLGAHENEVSRQGPQQQQNVPQQQVPPQQQAAQYQQEQQRREPQLPKLPQAQPRGDAQDMDFAPPEESRLKFELTGPQIISASTDSSTRQRTKSGVTQNPVSEQDKQRPVRNSRFDADNPRSSSPRTSRTDLDNPRTSGTKNAGSGRSRAAQGSSIDGASGRSRRAGRTSRNRLPSAIRDTGTTHSGRKKSAGPLRAIILVILLITTCGAVGYFNRDYFSTLAQEVFFFPSDKPKSLRDEARKMNGGDEADEETGSEAEEVQPDASGDADLP